MVICIGDGGGAGAVLSASHPYHPHPLTSPGHHTIEFFDLSHPALAGIALKRGSRSSWKSDARAYNAATRRRRLHRLLLLFSRICIRN